MHLSVGDGRSLGCQHFGNLRILCTCSGEGAASQQQHDERRITGRKRTHVYESSGDEDILVHLLALPPSNDQLFALVNELYTQPGRRVQPGEGAWSIRACRDASG